LEIKPQTKLVEKEIRTTKLEVGTKPLVIEQMNRHCSGGDRCLKGCTILSFIFCHILKILGMKSKV
jgi:hypothetical protein